MKQLITLLVLLQLVTFGALAEVYVLEGVYQGEDLYVKNPFSNEGVGFCVYEVLVNGEISSDEINSSAFAIDLTQYGLNQGDDLLITIRSKSNCEPKVINPNAISPKSSCSFANISLDQKGKLSWTTEGEQGKLPFVVEHFKWNKWVEIGSVLGEGTAKTHHYSVMVKLPSGENKLRIKQRDYSNIRLSDEVTLTLTKPEVILNSDKVNDYIEFTGDTHYELYNVYGVLVKTGFGNKILVNSLEKGRYYLNFEKTLGLEIKKR